MADTVKSATTLSMVQEFSDGDTRTLTVENPNTAINLKAQINELGTFMAQSQVSLGDKDAAAFLRFRSAAIIDRITTDYDLTPTV